MWPRCWARSRACGCFRSRARRPNDEDRSSASSGEQLDGVGIDPRLFRAFGIETVPTYVVTSSDFDLCDGFDCRTQVPPHDRMSGNVSAAYALETFARGGGPGALLAAQHLARLERQVP